MITKIDFENRAVSRSASELMAEIKEHLTASLQAIVAYKVKSEVSTEILRLTYRPGIVSALVARHDIPTKKSVKDETAFRIIDAMMNTFIRIGITEVEITKVRDSIRASLVAIGYSEERVKERYPEFKEQALLAVALVGLCPSSAIIPKGYSVAEDGSLFRSLSGVKDA